MLIFIPWDVIFTINGFWGFDSNYHSGVEFFNLPLEEWLFFICIPFACMFTHYALILYFPNAKIGNLAIKKITIIFLIILITLIFINYDKWYTLVNFSLAFISTIIVFKYNLKLLKRFFLSYTVILIPFFIVNGILTGSWIEGQIVWYNDAENMGLRIGTIPIEDSIYAYSMILINLFLFELYSYESRSGLKACFNKKVNDQV